jgi:endonuclease YncB( thermonuclease family)
MSVSIHRLLVLLIATAAGIVLAAGEAPALDQARPACAGLEPGPTRTVTRILDGETVALDDGTELRLIGALAPRATDSGAELSAWPAEIAATQELRALLLGKSVDLAFGGERSDRYGRHQAHAHIRESDSRRWVQGHLLEQGLARAYTVAGNRACADALLEAERSARDARRGLWAEAAYQAKPADKPSQLARSRSTFQLVEGRIAAVAQVRGMIYLNFNADWRHAFTTAVRRGDRGLLGADGNNPKMLEGRLVRVRGWIEQRSGASNGPAIELSTAGLVEFLDEPGSGAAAARPVPDRGGAGRRASPPEAPPQPPAPQPAPEPWAPPQSPVPSPPWA